MERCGCLADALQILMLLPDLLQLRAQLGQPVGGGLNLPQRIGDLGGA
jgi:hypothetical protein